MSAYYRLVYGRIGAVIIFLLLNFSCQKELEPHSPGMEEKQNKAMKLQGHLHQTKTFNADVVLKWFDLKYRILRQQQQLQKSGVTSLVVRYYGYLGIALYESVVPGMPAYRSLAGQLTDMPAMPKTENGKAYHWAASANSALAFVHKSFLPFTSASNKVSIDSLEQALNNDFRDEVDSATLSRSVAFGKEVAKRIIEWSLTDGTFNVWPAYVLPVGPGLWVPTAPNFFAARGAYYGDQRTFTPGVIAMALPGSPPPYSTDPSSDFYQAEKEVYDASLNRSQADSIHALYWRGTGGGTAAIHWFAILKKLLLENSMMLDQASLAYCKLGMAQYDAAVVAFKSQFTYNMLRPITYIRNVLGYSSWLPFQTPGAPNPDWPDGFLTDYSGSAAALSTLFGDNYTVNTAGTHHETSMSQGYTFSSFREAAEHGGMSRFLTGVSTKGSVDAGMYIGYKTVEVMNSRIKFQK